MCDDNFLSPVQSYTDTSLNYPILILFFAQYVHQDVQTAKMIATGDVAKLDTKHLFDKYLSTESPSEVNISSSLKTRITTLIDVKNGCGAVEPSEIKHQELFQSLESAQAEVKVMVT